MFNTFYECYFFVFVLTVNSYVANFFITCKVLHVENYNDNDICKCVALKINYQRKIKGFVFYIFLKKKKRVKFDRKGAILVFIMIKICSKCFKYVTQ